MAKKLIVPSDKLTISYAGHVVIGEEHARRWISRLIEYAGEERANSPFAKGERQVYLSFVTEMEFGKVLTREDLKYFMDKLSFVLTSAGTFTTFDDLGLIEDLLRNGDTISEMRGDKFDRVLAILWDKKFLAIAAANGISASVLKDRVRQEQEKHAAAEKAKRVRAATALLRAEGFSVLQRKKTVVDTKEVSPLTSLSGDDA